MQKAFNALMVWIVVFVASMATMFGYVLPAVFNMSSSLMFPIMAVLLPTTVVFGFWTMRRIIWSFRRLSQWRS